MKKFLGLVILAIATFASSPSYALNLGNSRLSGNLEVQIGLAVLYYDYSLNRVADISDLLQTEEGVKTVNYLVSSNQAIEVQLEMPEIDFDSMDDAGGANACVDMSMLIY